MKLPNRLAATTTSYEPYGLEEALAGIAASGFRYVELAAIQPSQSARTRSASSITGPREVLSRIAVGFISRNSRSPIKCLVAVVSGQWSET